MSKASEQRELREQAIDRLLAPDGYALKPGDTLYTTTLHTSRSGMSRNIKVVRILDGKPTDISGLVARATGSRWADDGGVTVGGCGMDMGFSLIYDLSRTLHPRGFLCAGSGVCHSNDHSNDYGTASRMADEALGFTVHDRREHFTEWRAKVQDLLDNTLNYRGDRHHDDGGYAISQRWL
jgi:hypothetical protein